MKKLKTIVMLTLIITLLFTPKIYTYIFPPHINPETLPEPATPPIADALTRALDQLIAQNWNQLAQQASSLEQLPVQNQYLLTEISDLLIQLAGTFQQINITLLITELLIERGALERAEEELEEIGSLINEANETITELEQKINQTLLAFNLQPTQLQQKMNQVKNLLNNFIQRKTELQQKLEEIFLENRARNPNKNKHKNSGKYISNPPGSTVEIQGILVANNTPLNNKTIEIFLFNQTYTTNITIQTNITGTFETPVKLPEIYIESIAIFAIYKPTEEEAEQYVPSISNVIEMNITYQTPTITILSAPERVRPSLQYAIQGIVELNNTPLANWPTNITIYQTTIETQTDSQGRFTYTFKVPETPPTDAMNIVVETKPRGATGPGQTIITIPLEYLDSELTVKLPKKALAGVNFEVSGTAKTAEGPVKNATIIIRIGQIIATTRTNENGNFTVKVHASPLTLSRKITVTIILMPQEPWIRIQAVEKEIDIVNPLVVIVPLIPIIAPIIYLSKPRRKMGKNTHINY